MSLAFEGMNGIYGSAAHEALAEPSFEESLTRLDALAILLDSAVRIPGTNVVVGLDALLGLVRDGAWVRLSGAYRTSVQGGPPYSDTIPFAHKLVESYAYPQDRLEPRVISAIRDALPAGRAQCRELVRHAGHCEQ